jgi:hypothetical protein
VLRDLPDPGDGERAFGGTDRCRGCLLFAPVDANERVGYQRPRSDQLGTTDPGPDPVSPLEMRLCARCGLAQLLPDPTVPEEPLLKRGSGGRGVVVGNLTAA